MTTANALPNDWALIATWALGAVEHGVALNCEQDGGAARRARGDRFELPMVRWRADNAAPDAFATPPV